jgi:hypothetical protein
MSISKNSLLSSDVTTVPVKVKYTSSYYYDTLADNGIKINKGVNNPVYSYQKVEEDTLVYRFAKHMYYSNFLSGSFPVTASQYENWMQSTAASGTLESDRRYFPTNSLDEITVIGIPRSRFGEKVSPMSFRLINSGSYNIYDDGNGNISDYGTGSVATYINNLYQTNPQQFYYSLPSISGSIHVGNILYSQGVVIITNQEYKDIIPT